MRLVFVSPRAWLVATGRAGIHGGAELQVTRLARALAARRHDVTVMTEGDPAAPVETVAGVRVRQAWSPSSGLPLVGIVQQAGRLGRIIDGERPDVVILRAASPFVGLLADQARRRGHRFVFMTSNDSQVDGRWERAANWRDRWLYRRGLARATSIVTQTADQAAGLRARYGLDGFHLPSAVSAPPDPAPTIVPTNVFWAGRFEPHKRPHLLLDMARRARDLHFHVAGWLPPGRNYAVRFEADARREPNVTLAGRLSPEAMEAGYRRAIALLSTAEHEGVSNTFLESWRLGLPVVSLGSDPDGVIARFDLGAHDTDPDRALAALRLLRDDPARRAVVGANARRYMQQHEEGSVVSRFETHLQSLVA